MLSLNNYLREGQTILPNIILENYHQIGLSNEEFLLWLHLYKSHLKGDNFPDLKEIGQLMGYRQQEIYAFLNQLIQKNIITIDSGKDRAGRIVDTYNFYPIFDKLEVMNQQKIQQQEISSYESEVRKLYQLFEQEFGRPLSPIEYQRIGQWLQQDDYQPELIQCALREAVLNQAYSLNYIDRILLSWERKNITTSQQVEVEHDRRKKQFLQKEAQLQSSNQVLPKIPMHNWLEEDKL